MQYNRGAPTFLWWYAENYQSAEGNELLIVNALFKEMAKKNVKDGVHITIRGYYFVHCAMYIHCAMYMYMIPIWHRLPSWGLPRFVQSHWGLYEDNRRQGCSCFRALPIQSGTFDTVRDVWWSVQLFYLLQLTHRIKTFHWIADKSHGATRLTKENNGHSIVRVVGIHTVPSGIRNGYLLFYCGLENT